jgi:hypothetical protein
LLKRFCKGKKGERSQKISARDRAPEGAKPLTFASHATSTLSHRRDASSSAGQCSQHIGTRRDCLLLVPSDAAERIGTRWDVRSSCCPMQPKELAHAGDVHFLVQPMQPDESAHASVVRSSCRPIQPAHAGMSAPRAADAAEPIGAASRWGTFLRQLCGAGTGPQQQGSPGTCGVGAQGAPAGARCRKEVPHLGGVRKLTPSYPALRLLVLQPRPK